MEKNSHRILGVFALLLLILALGVVLGIQTDSKITGEKITLSQSTDFVTVQDSRFFLDGKEFTFAGTNAYYLPNYQKIEPSLVTNTLNAFEESGVRVVRMWAFYDGYDCGWSSEDANETVIQKSPGVYDEDALRDLDRVISEGKERGIYFILPFINFWDELGGICQYNTWAGAENPGQNMEFFINNPQTQKWYRDYIKMLLTRVNTETGIAYKDEPAIFAWEIMNEGQYPGQGDPKVLRDWYQEMAQFIKSIDGNHLVGTGEDGFDDGSLGRWSVEGNFVHEDYTYLNYSNSYILRAGKGTSFVYNIQIPEIDFGSVHWYPNHYGFGSSYKGSTREEIYRGMRAWFSDHKRLANEQGKPILVGEYGWAGWGNEETLEYYNDLWRLSEELEIDGTMLWQLTVDFNKCWEYGGNICWPGGRQDEKLYNAYVNHINNMADLKVTPQKPNNPLKITITQPPTDNSREDSLNDSVRDSLDEINTEENILVTLEANPVEESIYKSQIMMLVAIIISIIAVLIMIYFIYNDSPKSLRKKGFYNQFY